MPKKVLNKCEQQSFAHATLKENYPLTESEIYKSCVTPELLERFSPTYVRENGILFTGDSLQWLKEVRDESIDLVFADPPYNIKKADWDKFESQEQYIQWSIRWIKEA